MRSAPTLLFFAGLTLTGVAQAEDAGGILVASTASGFEEGGPKPMAMRALRCSPATTPSKAPLVVYLPPPKSPEIDAVLRGVLKWDEAMFERQRQILESTAGRPCFIRKESAVAVMEAVALDPGGVGIVSATTPIVDGVLRIWGESATPPPAPAEEGP